MSNQRIVGIDLGTTNSLVAFMQGDVPVVIPGDDGLNLVPSVVALDENDQIIVLLLSASSEGMPSSLPGQFPRRARFCRTAEVASPSMGL